MYVPVVGVHDKSIQQRCPAAGNSNPSESRSVPPHWSLFGLGGSSQKLAVVLVCYSNFEIMNHASSSSSSSSCIIYATYPFYVRSHHHHRASKHSIVQSCSFFDSACLSYRTTLLLIEILRKHQQVRTQNFSSSFPHRSVALRRKE